MKAIATTSKKTVKTTKPVTKTKGTVPALAEIPPSVEALDQSKVIKQLIANGKEKGFLTLDEINDALPPGESNAEQLDEIFMILSEMNIEVIDSAGNVSLAKAAAPPAAWTYLSRIWSAVTRTRAPG